MSCYIAYAAKMILFEKLTVHGKKHYYIFRTMLNYVGKKLKENQNSYVGLLILVPLVDDEIKIDILRHLSMKDIGEKLWVSVIQRERNKWGELYVKFRIYK